MVMELRELKAFVAVVEEGGMSAASRRLHVSQSALSQTISNIEHELGVKLLLRSSSGVRPTAAGRTFLTEARGVLARYGQALRTMSEYTTEGNGIIRLGIPLELPDEVLPQALARFSQDCPTARVIPRHLTTAAQFEALRAAELDVGLVRERPTGAEFDTMLLLRENLGVLIATEVAEKLGAVGEIPLEALRDLEWLGFPRSGSPAWFDELTAIFRTHGIGVDAPIEADQALIPAVKYVGVSAGYAFALAPPSWQHRPMPEGVRWSALAGNPVIRRTWVVWPATSRRRDVGHLVAAFEVFDL